jgi:hypothetical protein
MHVICDEHGSPNSDDYVAELEPEGYPNNAVVLCGYSNCKNPGKMYLAEKEYKENDHSGKTIFPAEMTVLLRENLPKQARYLENHPSRPIRPKRFHSIMVLST